MQWTDDEICRKCGSGIEHHAYDTEGWVCPGSTTEYFERALPEDVGDLPDEHPKLTPLLERIGDQLIAVLEEDTGSDLHEALKEFYKTDDDDAISALIRKIAISHLED